MDAGLSRILYDRYLKLKRVVIGVALKFKNSVPARRLLILGSLSMTIAAIAIALTPSTKLSTNYSWTPSTTTTKDATLIGESLVLARQTPSQLKVTFTFTQASFPSKEILFASSRNFVNNESLLIEGENSTVTLSVAGEAIVSALLHSNKNSQIEIRYDNATGFAVREDGVLLADAPGRFFLFSGFYHSANSLTLPTAEVTTFPYAFTPSLVQRIFAVIFLLGLLVLIFATIKNRASSKFQFFNALSARGRPLKKLLVVSSIATFLLFVFWLFFGPIALDDGWVVQNAQSLIHGTNFRVVHQAWDTRTPSGLVSLWIERLVVLTSNQLLWIRFIPFVLVVFTWRLGRKQIKELSSNSTTTTLSYDVLFSLFAISWLFTTRSEILITLLSLLVLRNIISFCANPDIFKLTSSGILASIAFSIHPSGIITFAPIIAVVPLMLRLIRNEKTLSISGTIGAAAASASTALFLLTYGWDLHSLQQTSSLWGSYIRRDWSDEIERYRYLFDGSYWDTTSRRLTIFIIFAGLILTSTIRKTDLSKQNVIAAQSLLIGVLLLSATQTKWPWHFGTLSVFACVTFALAMHQIRTTPRRESPLFWDTNSSVIIGTSVVAVIVWQSWNLWGIFAIPNKVPKQLLDLTNFFRTPSFWLIFGIMVLVIAKFKNPFIRTAGSLSMEFLVVLTIVFNVVLIGNAGLRTQSWSIAKQSIRSITHSPSCGIADSIAVTDLWDLRIPTTLEVFIGDAQYSQFNVKAESPLDRDQVLGPVPGVETTQFASDWYVASQLQTNLVLRIEDAKNVSEIGIQLGNQNDPDSEYIPIVTGQISKPIETETTYLDFGTMPTLELGSKFQLIIKTFEPGQNFAISKPLLTESKPLSDVVSQHNLSAKIDPFFKLYFPCIHESALDQGISIKPDLIIGNIPLVGTSPSRYMTEENNLINLKINWPTGIAFSQTSNAIPPIFAIIDSNDSQSDIKITNIASKDLELIN